MKRNQEKIVPSNLPYKSKNGHSSIMGQSPYAQPNSFWLILTRQAQFSYTYSLHWLTQFTFAENSPGRALGLRYEFSAFKGNSARLAVCLLRSVKFVVSVFVPFQFRNRKLNFRWCRGTGCGWEWTATARSWRRRRPLCMTVRLGFGEQMLKEGPSFFSIFWIVFAWFTFLTLLF